MTETKKPWCIYRGLSFIPMGIGKIEKESGNSAHIRYSEGQFHPLAVWEIKYLERFSTPEKAIEIFSEKTNSRIERTRADFFTNFPSQKARSNGVSKTKVWELADPPPSGTPFSSFNHSMIEIGLNSFLRLIGRKK